MTQQSTEFITLSTVMCPRCFQVIYQGHVSLTLYPDPPLEFELAKRGVGEWNRELAFSKWMEHMKLCKVRERQ